MDSTGFYLRPNVVTDSVTDDAYSRNREKQYFPDTYLDSPILITVRTKWLLHLHLEEDDKSDKSQLARTVAEVKTILPKWSEYTIVDPDEYPRFYHLPWVSTLSDEFNEAADIATEIYSKVSSVTSKRLGVPLPSLRPLISEHILYWLHRWSFFDSLVEEFSRVSSSSGPNVVIIKLGDHTQVIATKDVWFIDTKVAGKILLTYDQVLMLKDLMFSRAQVMIAATLFFGDPDPIINAVIATYTWHEKCLIRHGNPGFELLKQTEALAKAYLSEMIDTIFENDGPYSRMVSKIRQKETDLGTIANYLVDDFDRVLKSQTDVQTVTEIFGLLKISGHPLVDPLVGGQSAAEEARSPDETLYSDAIQLDWEFKRTMLINYIRVEGKWPDLEFAQGSPVTALRGHANRQFKGLNRNSYPLWNWRYCRFRKIVDFDYSPNYLDLMDDKAISFYRSNVATTWDTDVAPKSHRRLLMELVNREEFDVKKIVTLIVRREIPFDWFIVSLHPKEREFKLAPRMFSMLVLEIRVFFALTEANIADKIFPYLPQQTMTKSRLAITKQFLEMTRPMTETESLRMFIEIDLSRWNLRWRAMAVNPVARTLNDMFGVVGIFDFCHEFFSKAMILVRVADCRPEGIEKEDPPESELLWYNHMGGFEGICQKLWTICTYSMVALALHDMPLSYILLGQGDNQILSVLTSRDPLRSEKEVLTTLRDAITERVSAICRSVNQIVKPEECLESTSVITYSKDVYVLGVYRPTTLKFHSRLFPHSSEIFPSVRTNIGAIFSTAVAGAEKSEKPMISYFLACLYSALYLVRCSKKRGPFGMLLSTYRRNLKVKFSKFIEFCLTLPSEAGGFPVLPFVGFMYKGGSDPLGKSLSALVGLGLDSDSRLYNRMLSQLSYDRLYKPEPKLASLFMDPFSAPFDKPPTAVDGIAQSTIEALGPHVRIPDIEELMRADTSIYLDDLVNILSTARPLNPLIIRDILDCSILGVADTISRMFVATRTLQNVVRETGVQVVSSVLHLESKGLEYMYNRFVTLPNEPAQKKTIYQLTKELRDRWFPGQDNPIVGVTTYQPLDFPVLWGPDSLKSEGINAVLVTQTDPYNTRGPYDPYVGSKTREKRSEHGYKIVGTETASQSIRKLQLISSQVGEDPNMKLILDAVAWTRTNTRLSDVSAQLTGVSGGNGIHRYAARAGHQEAYNIGSPNFATHCVVSTDNTGYLSGGALDYPIMFQEFILMGLWLLMTRHLREGTNFLAVTIVTEGTDLDPLPGVEVKISDFTNHKILRYPHNPLTFVPHLKLERVTGAVSHRSLPVVYSFEPTHELRRHVLEAYFKTILRSHSAGRQIADGARLMFQTDTLDIAEVVSNQLYTIAECIKNVVLDEAISNYMMTALRGKHRWKVDTYSYKLISPLVQTISPLFGHPLLKPDPLTPYLGLYDNPVYAGGYNSPHHKYCGFIAGLIHTALQGADNGYNYRTVGIFTSSNNHAVSESLLTCLLVDSYMWLRRNELPVDTVNKIIGGTLIPTMRAQHREEDKVETLYYSITKMQSRLELTAPTVARTLKRYHGKRIIGYQIPIKDLLKATRNIDEWGIPVTPPKFKTAPTIIRTRGGPLSTRAISVKVLESMSGIRSLTDANVTEMDILRSIYERSASAGYTGSGSALSVWSLFSSILAKKPLILIGSGFGAVARVALDAGCPFVYGLDKQETIPIKAHRFRFYKPPLVMMCQYEDRYLQMPESYMTSGDWLDSRVCHRVLQYDQGDCTIVIDIQAGQQRYGLEVLLNVIKQKRAGNIILRLYLTMLESYQIIADLCSSDVTFSWYDIEGSMEITQSVVVITGWSQDLSIALRFEHKSTLSPIRIPRVLEPTSTHTRAAALSDVIFNVIYVSPSQTLEDLELAVSQIILDSIGDYDSRFSYSQWTRYLRAKLALQWLISIPDADKFEELARWYAEGGTTLIVESHKLWITVDWSVCYHLCTFGARLITRT